MGTFRVELQAVGNHGCQREVKDGEKVEGCKQPGCVDCITREYVQKLLAAGASFSTMGQLNNVGYAQLTHWPGQRGTVTDDLLSGVRAGNF
jgi:hypothetical protein